MLLKHRAEIIDKINFNVNFASEKQINALFKQHFWLYSYLYMCVDDDIKAIQDVADLKRDYYNKLYETMLYEYDPLENYNMTEEEHGNANRSTNNTTSNTNVTTPSDWKTTVKNSGYDDGATPAETSETEQSGVYTVTDNGTGNGSSAETNARTLKRYGNIGVQTSMDMIQKQRDITMNIIEQYLKEFENCFNLEF